MVDQDQVREPVLIEVELDVLNVRNMIILLKTVQTQRQKESQNKYRKCIIIQKSDSIKGSSGRHL